GERTDVTGGGREPDALPEVRGHEPEHHDGEHERADREVVAPPGRALGLFDRYEVDADHLSPGWRVARPTVTASAGPLASTSCRSTPRSSCRRRNGSATSTAQPSRCVSCVPRPDRRAGPPDRITPPSGSSVAAVQKKLSALWISSTMNSVTEPRMGSTVAGSAFPPPRPILMASASAGVTPSWR